MTATRLATSVAGVPPDWFNVMDYGAVGDATLSPGGGTDDTAAFQAAINAAKAANGTVYVPGPHYYRITDTLLCNLHSWRFTGAGSGGSGPALYFDTLVNKPLLSYPSTYLFELDHLTLVGRAGYPGNLVDVDGNGLGGTGSDCQQYHIHHMNMRADATTTLALLRLNKTVIAKIDNCRFADSKVHILDGGTNYINAVTISDCVFNPSCTDAHMRFTSGDIEMLRLVNNTHEAGTNTSAIKCGVNARFYKLLISGMWCGDSSPGVTWIDGIVAQSNTHVGTIRDCMFFLGGGVNDVAIKFGATDGSNNSGKWVVENCSILGSGNAFDTYTAQDYGKIHAYNNTYVSVTSVWKAGALVPFLYTSKDCLGELDKVAAFTAFNPANSGEKFAVGSINTWPANTAGVGYAAFNTAQLFGSVEVQVKSGATPEVRVQPAKVGFYNTAPVAQAARAGQLTDSTGGTVSTTLAAGITDAVAKNAIASLAAKVNALETIIHNLGLSL